MPAGWNDDCVGLEVNTAPTVAVLSLFSIVLLKIELRETSESESPPPAHPATLFTIILFVI